MIEYLDGNLGPADESEMRWDGSLTRGPEAGTDDPAVADLAHHVIHTLGPQPPLTAADVAAHVADLLDARGQLNRADEGTLRRAQAAATYLLGAYGA